MYVERSFSFRIPQFRTPVMPANSPACDSCNSDMHPIKLIDKSHGKMHTDFEYAPADAARSFWTGRYPIEGKVEAYLCAGCGRIAMFGRPAGADAAPAFKQDPALAARRPRPLPLNASPAASQSSTPPTAAPPAGTKRATRRSRHAFAWVAVVAQRNTIVGFARRSAAACRPIHGPSSVNRPVLQHGFTIMYLCTLY